jgi:hypothetical protein
VQYICMYYAHTYSLTHTLGRYIHTYIRIYIRTLSHEGKFKQDEIYEVFYSART